MVRRKCTEDLNYTPSHKKRYTNQLAATPRITRAMTTNAARQAVLGTNELLENIIVHLPAKNIFGIQRVCKQFKEVIAASPGIQRKVFLRLKGQSREHWLLERRRPVDDEEPHFRKPQSADRPSRIRSPVVLNPLLNLLNLDSSSCAIRLCHHHCENVETPWKPTVSRQHFSFFDTFITDPPVRKAAFEIKVTSDGPDPRPSNTPMRSRLDGWSVSYDIVVVSETGLRLGDVISKVFESSLERSGEVNTRDTPPIAQEMNLFQTRHGWAVLKDQHLGRFVISLLDIVVPTADEWVAVRADLANRPA